MSFLLGQVLCLVNQLYDCGLTENDIGIITPYTLQARELRLMSVEFFGDKQPKIGSVEEFQGEYDSVRKAINTYTYK